MSQPLEVLHQFCSRLADSTSDFWSALLLVQALLSVTLDYGNYFGSSGWINVWNLPTFNGEFSLAQFWIYSGKRDEVNTIEAGWINFPDYKEPKFFTYWTSNGYKNNGCYNLDCPGFVQISKKGIVGSPLWPISTYGGQQYEFSLTIYKDKQNGNWWLRYLDEDLGYWPGSIFTTLYGKSDGINWGGEIINTGTGGHHTYNEMDCDHFPSEDYGHACYFRNLVYTEDSGAMKDAKNLVPFASRPE